MTGYTGILLTLINRYCKAGRNKMLIKHNNQAIAVILRFIRMFLCSRRKKPLLLCL